jgi:hypothetical protein
MHNAAIPYHLRARLLQLEPSLDLAWEQELKQVFAQISLDVKQSIDHQILRGKQIKWDSDQDLFSYQGMHSVEQLYYKLTNEKIKLFAKTLESSLKSLLDLTDALQIADYLESALDQIDKIDVAENFQMQREKLELRRTFLLNAAEIIRNLKIKDQDGLRRLTGLQMKCFILEVFVKQQLLGYWFKPLLKKQADEMKHPVFRYFLIKEQKIRHFDIVRTSQFLYIVAPVMDVQQNPYSIRRFIIEEQGALPDQIYLNVLVLDLKDDVDNDMIDALKMQMQRMVTLQSQIHLDVMDIVHGLEQVCELQLIPLLVEPIQVVDKNADVVAQRHLKNFENVLTQTYLIPIREAIKNHLSHIEEFDYLYLHVHKTFSELLACYREFKSQPAFIFNAYIQNFEYKLLGFLKLLEKRKPETFIPMNRHEWEVMHHRAEQPVREIQSAVSDHLQTYRDLKMQLNKQRRILQQEQKKSMLKKLWSKDTSQQDYELLSTKPQKMKRDIFLTIIQVPRTYANCSVFIEFESLQNLFHIERHYVFPCGDNGLTRLPMLIHLPESYEEFEVEDFNASMSLDLNFSAGSKAQNNSDEALTYES